MPDHTILTISSGPSLGPAMNVLFNHSATAATAEIAGLALCASQNREFEAPMDMLKTSA